MEPCCRLCVFNVIPPFAVRADLQLAGSYLLGLHYISLFTLPFVDINKRQSEETNVISQLLLIPGRGMRE